MHAARGSLASHPLGSRQKAQLWSRTSANKIAGGSTSAETLCEHGRLHSSAFRFATNIPIQRNPLARQTEPEAGFALAYAYNQAGCSSMPGDKESWRKSCRRMFSCLANQLQQETPGPGTVHLVTRCRSQPARDCSVDFSRVEDPLSAAPG